MNTLDAVGDLRLTGLTKRLGSFTAVVSSVISLISGGRGN